MELSVQSGHFAYFRIEVVPNEAPPLFDIRLFEVLDAEIAPGWVARQNDGVLTLGPSSWGVSGFWEAYLDRQDWAIRDYLYERNKLME
ncbi:hypothetical protein C6W10_27790 [Plantactinospora sp. BB1]|nr:hypothetical protein C6W10_27790 [Plantactinospora sp. BB1]